MSVRAIVRAALAWFTGAIVAVGVGMFALSRIGYGFTAGNVQPPVNAVANDGRMSPAGSLGPAAPEPSSEPTPDPRPSTPRASAHATPGFVVRPRPPVTTPPVAHERVLYTTGGSATVACEGAQGSLARVLYWTPAQAFHVDDFQRGPAAQVSVKFEGHDSGVLLTARCVGGLPRGSTSTLSGEHKEDD